MANENRGTGRKILDHEITVSFARSGGPGGQGVNTAESKAVLRWHIGNSGAFSEEEKALIRAKATNTTEGDEIVLHCSEQRKQLQNKSLCIERLHAMVNEAIKVQEPRKERKKVPMGVKRRNEDSDFREKQKKSARGRVDSKE